MTENDANKAPGGALGIGAGQITALANVPEPAEVTSSASNALDVVFIVSSTLFLLLSVFWLAGLIRGKPLFDNLPSWFSGALQSGKAALSALGTSSLLGILRTWSNRKTSPNYLLWIVIMFFILGGSAVGLAFIPHQESKAPSPADVHFTAQYPAPLLFVHHYPKKEEESLAEQPRHGDYGPSYLAHIMLPADLTTQFDATFTGLDADSKLHDSKDTVKYTDMCLARAAGDHQLVSSIYLACVGGDCAVDKGRDKGLAAACPIGDQPFESPHGSIFSPSSVFAATESARSLRPNAPFWTVPTLDTLQRTNSQKRVGYTQFDIDLKPSNALSGSDSYQYQVLVNGQPIFFNGLPPEVFRDGFSAAGTIHFSFGLENLSFSGADEGLEDLRVELYFFKNGVETLHGALQRQYAALRDAAPVAFSSSIGRGTWSGEYKIPPDENKFEVLVNSVPHGADAMKMKAVFDGAHIEFDGRPAVLVVRPPLRIPPFYGVVIGVTQPTGQVQFTYNAQEVSKVCEWAKTKGRTSRLIRSDLRRYQPGNRAYAPCK